MRKHNGMPDLGQADGWTESEWRRAPVERVPISRLEGTNLGGYLDPRIAERYARQRGGKKPYVVKRGGRYFIADGHHRVTGAALRGERYIACRVMRVR